MQRRALYWIAGAAAAVAGVAAARCAFSAPPYCGPQSDHFDGTRFFNLDRVDQDSLAFLKWQLSRDAGEWPDWIDEEPGPRPPERVGESDLRITFVNHATLLIQIGGINLLTDPIWSERCSPVSWAGPRRHRLPGIRFEDLPPIDAVLLSHNHYDHLDLPTLVRLDRQHEPLFAAGLGNAALLEREGIGGKIHDLDWWDSFQMGAVELTFVPAQHFSARGACDRNRTLWGGWCLRGPGRSVYFAGDTGWGSHFALIRERLGSPDVSLLPIGAFRPRWFMAPVHIDPQDALRAHETLGSRISIPMHYGTFFLGDDGEREPVDELRRALRQTDLEDEFVILEHGRFFELRS